jgi:hypothetical protein
MNRELSRKNIRLGIVLFVIALAIFAGSIVVAEIYNALAS